MNFFTKTSFTLLVILIKVAHGVRADEAVMYASNVIREINKQKGITFYDP